MCVPKLHFYSGQPLQNLSGVDMEPRHRVFGWFDSSGGSCFWSLPTVAALASAIHLRP